MQYIKIFISSTLTIFAFMFDKVYDVKKPLLTQFASNEAYVGIVWCTLTLFMFGFYWKSWNEHKGFQKIEAAFSIIFSAFMLLGRTFSVHDSLKMLETQKIMTLFAGIGWCLFFYMLFRWVVYFIDKQPDMIIAVPRCTKKFQVMAFFIILLCWLPQLLLSLPGNVPIDGMDQLSQWFGYRNPNNQHPWFTTIIFGTLMSIGRGISDNAGLLIVMIFQFLFCSWAYSHVCLTVDKYAGRKAAYFTTAFFAILPVWGALASALIKDTLFFPVFALYFCCFVDIFEDNGVVSIEKWIIFGILSFLVCIIRNDGIYRIIFAGIALLMALRKTKKQLLFLLVGVFICMIMYNELIFNICGVAKGPIGEMLTIPFQQTARYSRDHGKDISEEEKNIINKILPYDKLAKRYNPQLSNPIKSQTKKFGNRDFVKYLYVWAKMGMRHPGTYIQATINNIYGYFYPFKNYNINAFYYTYIAKMYNKGWFNFHYIGSPKKKDTINNYNNAWRVIPGIALLSNPGTYTWISLIGIMLLLKKKKYRELVVFSVIILQIAICCASPINGLLRLVMPLMACTPVMLAWLWYTLKGKEFAR